MKLSAIKRKNRLRENQILTLLLVLGIMVLPWWPLTIGAILLIVAFFVKQFWITAVLAVLGLCWIAMGIGIFLLLLGIGLKVKEGSYRTFEKHRIEVDPDGLKKLRAIDRLALDKFGGDLKQALYYVTETPDLYRWERRDYIWDWTDYERNHVIKKYGKDPMRVAEKSKKDPLTLAWIRSALEADPRRDETAFSVHKAACTGKGFAPGIDGSDDSFTLHFGEFGSYGCESTLYHDTYRDEEFYIVTPENGRGVLLIYPAEDWEPEEQMRAMLGME